MRELQGVTFRWMEPKDVSALGLLAGRIWNAHYRSIIAQAQIDFMLPRSYSAEALAAQMQSGQRFLLAEIGDEMIGFLSVSELRTISNEILRGKDVEYLSEQGEARSVGFGEGSPTNEYFFLHKFYIAPECQGKGLGKKMFTELLRLMPEIKRIRLQVHRRNVNSWNFYLKQGFVIEQEADFEIGEGFQMNDYVMELVVSR